ncbi:unnamed protein product [Brachionus calyciflorus]|uniref:Uncharacterized protein n=1 Tax=Brachionus calyciflorus TaxID=104777 RepID=A0A814F522_9BILA|nr:unnamed protein product [Brachionus calyciflorus]
MIANHIQGSKINSPDRPSNFNYNTTIVALNPFKKDLFDDLKPDLSTSSTHSSTIGNDTNLAKLLNQRKFLINKNIRFYEPVKDAEIIAQMHLLRSKLQSSYGSNKTKKFKDFQKDKLVTSQDLTPIFKKDDLRIPSQNEDILKGDSIRDVNSVSNNYQQKEEMVSKNDFVKDGEDFPGLKKFSAYRRKKNTENSNNTSYKNLMIRTKKNQESTSPTKMSLPDINNKTLSHNNFNYVLRKSRKFRLNNIYKPVEHVHLVENKTKFDEPKQNTDNLINALNLSSSSVFDESLDRNEFKKIDQKIKNVSREQTWYCQDPNCEFKNLYGNNSSLHIKNEYPNERYQRMKNNEVKIVQNIISDIPNTLTTMSNYGNVTNIEKLLANKLSEFYTEKTRYVK